MSELAQQLRARADQARAALATAEADDDAYLADVHRGELEALARMAAEHGLRVPGLPAPARD